MFFPLLIHNLWPTVVTLFGCIQSVRYYAAFKHAKYRLQSMEAGMTQIHLRTLVTRHLQINP